MPWFVGIDEAGYGPNLGPLVQAAIAARVPADVDCLWMHLNQIVRRACDADDGRFLIDDSKLVHTGPLGLSRLERTVVGILTNKQTVGDCLASTASADTVTDLASEPWYLASEALPVVLASSDFNGSQEEFSKASRKQGVELRVVRCVATPTPRFNAILERLDTKAAVLAQGVIALIQDVIWSLPGDESVTFVIDKQGGRHYYAAMIQTAFADSWVTPIRESADESVYLVKKASRDIRLIFRPRADSGSLLVALASMLAKYLREVFMRQFNRYWQTHVPGLEATAGYPADARRFFDAIRPAMQRLNISEAAVWRRK